MTAFLPVSWPKLTIAMLAQLQDELGNQGTVPSMAKNMGKVLLRSKEVGLIGHDLLFDMLCM